jgi:hypothetical protein
MSLCAAVPPACAGVTKGRVEEACGGWAGRGAKINQAMMLADGLVESRMLIHVLSVRGGKARNSIPQRCLPSLNVTARLPRLGIV